MRHSLLTLLLIFFISQALAQDLLKSRRSSYYSRVYKLTNQQAESLYQDMYDLDKSYLNNLIDQFPADSIYTKELPVGHYLFVSIVNTDVNYTLRSVDNIFVSFLNNHRDLALILHDSAGREVSDAVVWVRSSHVPFDKSLKAYRRARSNKRGLVKVSYQGHDTFVQIDRRYNNTFLVRAGRQIPRTFPVNHLISPYYYFKQNIQSVVNGGSWRAPGLYHRVKHLVVKPSVYKGYVAFNKPLYKPHDTVRVKAYVTTRKGRPFSSKATVKLRQYYPDNLNKKLGTIEAYERGAYQYEFVLDDSLDLILDSRYTVSFESKKGRMYASEAFKLEAYELKSNQYAVRKDQPTDFKPATLYLKGEDSNGNPLYDARASIVLVPKSLKELFADQVFVPDTLWFHEVNLDPLGETRVDIPDSVMPLLAFEYEARISFFNASNERVVKTLSINHTSRPFPVTMDVKNDTVLFTAPDARYPVDGLVMLQAVYQGKLLSVKNVNIPYQEKITPLIDGYFINVPGKENRIKKFDLDKIPSNVSVTSNRTADSVSIFLNNPRRLSVRYYLFKNNHLMQAGVSEKSIALRRSAHASDLYALSIQYQWAGKPSTEEFTIPYDTRSLDITLDHPALVYPGQRAEFIITVKDYAGKPVKDADLTAFAITRKFDNPHIPSVPLFARSRAARSIFNEFNKTAIDLSRETRIDWAYWNPQLGLDSIAYYKFLFPDTGYFEYRIPAPVAQVAPYVVNKGQLSPIEIIHVDGQPYYYRSASGEAPYSIPVKPGRHTLAIRLHLDQVTIRDIVINESEKLIFSIDIHNLPPNATVTKMPYGFTKEEIGRLSRYFMVVKPFRDYEPFRPAYIQQGVRYYLIQPGNSYNYYSYNEKLIGPFYPGPVTYYDQTGFELLFDYEANSKYRFGKNILKIEKTEIAKYLRHGFRWTPPSTNFTEVAHSQSQIEKLWAIKEEKDPAFKKFPDFRQVTKSDGRLTLMLYPQDEPTIRLKSIFIINLDNPDDYFIYTGNLPSGEQFAPGRYQAFAVYQAGQYLRNDSIAIHPFGHTYLTMRGIPHPPDSLSKRILSLLEKWSDEQNYVLQNRQQELQQVRELYYEESTPVYFYENSVTGRVISVEDGQPLPGVNVIVRGTTIGTVTDASGYYSINCPANAVLVFSFIGLQTQEKAVNYQTEVNAALAMDVTQLSEVVVVGYGLQTKHSLTGTLTSQLSGRVAGVAIQGAPGAAPGFVSRDSVNIRIRGLSTLAGNDKPPLVIVDGVVMNFSDVDPSKITAMEILKADAALAMYGSAAANGVILVTTKPGATREYLKEISKRSIPKPQEESVPGSSIRKNFRDYAFWQPALRTDHDGKAKFSAVFPDDITGWNTYVLGMAGKKSGQTSSFIQSYKPLSAQTAQPHFLLKGDTTTLIAKITNYSNQEYDVVRTMTAGSQINQVGEVHVNKSRIDTMRVYSEGDTLHIRYSIRHQDYEDGEIHSIPILQPGAWESTGLFAPLLTDTVLTTKFLPDRGPVKVSMQADLLDVFKSEINFLRNYSYECNEQLASKAIALLMHQQLQEDNHSQHDKKEIIRIIRKLMTNQNKDGSWSWWNTGRGDYWITIHVVRALELAKSMKTVVTYNRQAMINYLEETLPQLPREQQMDVLIFLMEQGEKVEVKPLIDSVLQAPRATHWQKLRANRMLQLNGESPDWKWIASVRTHTLKGNWYWGEENNSVVNNDIANTLLVYQMMETANTPDHERTRVLFYFLEKRQASWKNTYASSTIIRVLMPALVKKAATTIPPVITLVGNTTEAITTFPATRVVSDTNSLTIKKTGGSPVYIAVYQEYQNTHPEPVAGEFEIKTSFDTDLHDLKAGQPVDLIAEVTVKSDAEYVMIEVPIPAGCSYASKKQTHASGEVYREYAYHKVNIYCRALRKGTYKYVINLLPRFTGNYLLNPATVQSMYFPVLFGRESMKRRVIR